MTRATGTDRTALADRIESGLGEGLREGTLPRGMFLAPVDWLHVLEALRCSGPLGEGWRDPKDKPPHLPGEHHSQDVLLLMKSQSRVDDGHGLRIGHVSLDHWRPHGGNGNFDDDVIGWMPLPDTSSFATVDRA